MEGQFQGQQRNFQGVMHQAQAFSQEKNGSERTIISRGKSCYNSLEARDKYGVTYTQLHLFGVGISTTCVVVRDVCTAIVETLAARFITIPSGNDLKAAVDGFLSKWGFPQCVGAIDGSHIPIIAPKENATDYFNRKRQHSIVLQAIVDHEYKFMDVYAGWPGSVHDARVLTNSSVFAKCENGTFLPNQTRNTSGKIFLC